MKNVKLIFIAPFVFAYVAVAAAAAFVPPDVVDVYDGDTITVRYESGETAKVRLIGIDTPEIADNPHGPASAYAPISRGLPRRASNWAPSGTRIRRHSDG